MGAYQADFQCNEPSTIFIGEIEVPTYYKFWKENTSLQMEIDKLKNRQRLMTCLLILQGITIILVSLKQLC